MNERYTIDGDSELELHLATICDDVSLNLRTLFPARVLEGIVLGGGYGRGEGGVLRGHGRDQSYNDVEYFVFVSGSRILRQRQYGTALDDLGHRLTEKHGIEIEFKLITHRELRRSPRSMFYYDLISGHRLVFGDPSLFDGCDHHREGCLLPLHDGTRLLMNRSSGLLFSLERLQRAEFTTEDADFVGRNIAKAQLALGDVILTERGLYHWSCRTRHERLQTVAQTAALTTALDEHHARGVEFKLRPQRTTASRKELLTLHESVSEEAGKLFLRFESRRLRTVFHTVDDYLDSPLDKCPETHPLRNRLINARQFGLRGLRNPRYPRQRLLHALCELLWLPRNQLLDAARVESYARLWSQFN